MNEFIRILLLAMIFVVVDLPWLFIQSSAVQDIIRDIQGGRSMNPRLLAGIPVYLALAYCVTQVVSAPRAFLLGMCMYALYDFTQLVTFDKYPLWFAMADSLWGGSLLAIVWWVGRHFGLTTENR